MAWLPTTRLQISGQRFMRRRLERALLGGDLRAVDESTRAPIRSMTAGLALSIFLLAGCLALALMRPQPGLGTAPILMEQQTGALFVRIGDTLHPVLNLASARLIAKTGADPQPMAATSLRQAKLGRLVGIPGAPQFVGAPLDSNESQWTVCDSRDGTTVIVGADQRSDPLRRDQTLLVTPTSGGSTYLLFDGRRSVVHPDDAATARALLLDGRSPRRVSPVLLNLIPESPSITAPRIPDAGRPGPGALAGFPVGSVLRVALAGGDEHYVVLREGIQRVGQVVADLIRFADSQGTRTAVAVAPDVIRAATAVTRLPVSDFPDHVGGPPTTDGPTFCTGWRHATPDGAIVSFSVGGLPIPAGQAPVTLAQADGAGPAVDAVYLPPGRAAFVRATGLSGVNARAGGRYLVSDTGVRFGVSDDDAAHDLGLADSLEASPWSLLTALPAGPTLSRASASVAQDVPPAGTRSP
ncbi:type VII secretion protein EccB [Mycobacterium sp.]|uniref:type VII secretion protein EccB n=1 Tax=Mycobacterium sp. TaxID=1785 RepID=UPI0025E4B1C3|nr:type VII secretion protein EccB [Mycobacterium sp.]